jgi:hypothetical protein
MMTTGHDGGAAFVKRSNQWKGGWMISLPRTLGASAAGALFG